MSTVEIVRAVILLPKLLPAVMTVKAIPDAAAMAGLRRSKNHLSTPFSGPLQSAPERPLCPHVEVNIFLTDTVWHICIGFQEGTDASAYVSVKVSTLTLENEWKPAQPMTTTRGTSTSN